jgi:hypothetical protein
MKMPTRNDKMTTSNNKVLKKHNGNIMCIRLDLIFKKINDTKMLKVGVLKGTRYDVEGHQGQKCMGNITSTSVKNISYFFELRVI